jgi:tetratricopeptide (TPR) repeat protein
VSEPLVRKAIALDQDDAEVRSRVALAALLKGDLQDAVAEADQVLPVNESCAGALGVKGAALVYSGNREEGRKALRQYLRLSPRDPAPPDPARADCDVAISRWKLPAGGDHGEARRPAIPEPSDCLSLAGGLAGPARSHGRGERCSANPADYLAVFVRDVCEAAAEILQRRVCAHARGSAQGGVARVRTLFYWESLLRGMSALGPGRVQTFFIFQELHAAGRDPRRRDHLSIFLKYRVWSQSGLNLAPR